jgi:hypothetical protein
MAKTWTKDEIEQALTQVGGLVRRFLKGLTVKGSANVSELGVHHMAVALAQKAAQERKKEPLVSTEKDPESGRSVFSIDPRYRKTIASFLASFHEPPETPRARRRRERAPAAAGRRRAGPAGTAAAPRRRSGRPRKAEAASLRPAARRRRRKAAPSAPGRADGFVRLPEDAATNWSFWAELVAFANEAAERGRTLRVTTDGSEVRLEVTR